MNTRYTERINGECWCGNNHKPFTGQHRPDTSDPEWPSGRAVCMCGGGNWGIPHHA